MRRLIVHPALAQPLIYDQEINLAARVALLESKLSMLDSGGSE